MSCVVKKVENTYSNMHQLRTDISSIGQVVNLHFTSIKKIETQLSQISVEVK